MSQGTDNLFERNKNITIVVLVLFFVLFTSVLCLILAEIYLKKVYGLGNPVIYDSNPLYGYRPLPNQDIVRFGGARLKFNNLGLRTDEDWDDKRDDKVLFLGDSVAYGGSSIDNKELFSYLALAGLKNYKSGNAGVKAWGVKNIHGLIVDSNFIPAKLYVTVIPEVDFSRGMTRIQGQPFFNVEPRFALLELWYYFCYKQNNRRYKEWQYFVDKEHQEIIVEIAVKKLKEIDTFLKKQGFQHIIFISPTYEQVFEGVPIDSLIHSLLEKYDLNPVYILDELKKYNLSEEDQKNMFYDTIHLNKRGHELWAKIIESYL